MHVSGILVVARPDAYDAAREALAGLAGVEIAIEEAAHRRMVAVLETESADGQQDLLRRIQALRSVALAELVCHHAGDEG